MIKAEFFIAIKPQAWQRAGYNRYTHTFFTKKETEMYEIEVRYRASEYAKANNITPVSGQVAISLDFFMPRPKSHSKKQRLNPWHISRPDFDNITKAATDAINGIFFVDDAQICCAQIRKMYATETQLPGIAVRIEELFNHSTG